MVFEGRAYRWYALIWGHCVCSGECFGERRGLIIGLECFASQQSKWLHIEGKQEQAIDVYEAPEFILLRSILRHRISTACGEIRQILSVTLYNNNIL